MELNEDLGKTSQKDVKKKNNNNNNKKRVKRGWLHCKSVNPMYKAHKRFPRRINNRFFYYYFFN